MSNVKPLTAKYAEAMFRRTKNGKKKMKWFDCWRSILAFEDESKRNFIDKVLVPNWGFRKGIDKLIVK